jgi:hypothetical protein
MQGFAASRLDRVLTYSAAVAVASAAVAAVLASSGRKAAEYQPGDKFAAVAGLDPSRSSATIVMFINSSCSHCQESGSVFHRIAQAPRTFQVVVIGYEDLDSIRQFVATSAIVADAVITVPEGAIRFSTVPKLAVLDRRGVVRFTWSGSRQIMTSEVSILAAARALAFGLDARNSDSCRSRMTGGVKTADGKWLI